MCDTSSILGPILGQIGPGRPSPDFIGPVRPTAGQAVGKLFAQAAPIAQAGYDIYSANREAGKVAEAAGRRAGQIEYGAKLQSEQAQEIAERRLGGQRGRIAKAGLKVKGTTRQMLEEQIKQDELDLLKIAHARDIGLENEQERVRKARLAGAKAATAALTGKEFQTSVRGLFGLSD